eukprot:CAMPEP_0178378560 /NCGR_PEP_ID=MMETSP0689_2-20121128/4491_1 /TAXON_ID=160604 /ORGANISM="Amphidinium massartii, Strain CS-259" /LENGTH=643 /DNA_ID=CAMNT_0019998637 /DNA_START=59 /DNA_END=1987 /DNA_ORIENTATION=+
MTAGEYTQNDVLLPVNHVQNDTDCVGYADSWERLVVTLAEEDRLLEATLQEEQREFEEWSRKQDAMLHATLVQQKEVEEQLVSLKLHMEKEQVRLDRVVKEVRVILSECRANRPNDVVDQRPPRSFSAGAFTPNAESLVDSHATTSHSLARPPSEDDEAIVAMRFLKRMVTHIYFDALCACVIFLNAIFVGVSLESQVRSPTRDRQQLHNNIMETLFLGFYCVELCLKLAVHQLSYFFNDEWRWNVFDFVLVIIAVYDFVSETLWVARTGNRTSLVIMKLLRLLKMLRMLQVVRLMRFFRELRLMLYSIVRSFRSLVWAVLMLTLIMYMFGLCFMQGGLVYLIDTKDWAVDGQDSTGHAAKVSGIENNWGNIALAIESLFMAVTGGKDWWEYSASFDPFDSEAADEVTIVYFVLFLLYIAFLAFAVLNTLTGIFVDASFDAAQNDQETVIQTALEMEKVKSKEISKVFGLIDEDGNSVITFEEFESKLSSPEVRAYFARLDIDATEARELFDVLSSPLEGSTTLNGTHSSANGHQHSGTNGHQHNGTGTASLFGGGLAEQPQHGFRCVSLDEFAEGLKKVKGPARSMDMVSLRIDCRRYSQELRSFMVFVETFFGHLKALLERRLGGPLQPPRDIVPLTERLL